MHFWYHHGYFNGIEREFRGFGMVEQYDTEEFATLINSKTFPALGNAEPGFHAPAVHTKTWFIRAPILGAIMCPISLLQFLIRITGASITASLV